MEIDIIFVVDFIFYMYEVKETIKFLIVATFVFVCELAKMVSEKSLFIRCVDAEIVTWQINISFISLKQYICK